MYHPNWTHLTGTIIKTISVEFLFFFPIYSCQPIHGQNTDDLKLLKPKTHLPKKN